MSIKAMVWAWAQMDLTSTETLVLLALADRANDEGLCWPGQEGMAKKCHLSREAVNRNIKRLEVLGKVTIIQRKDDAQRQLTNQYQLALPREGGVTENHSGRVTLNREPCDFNGESRVTQDHTNLQSESSEETSSKSITPTASKNSSEQDAFEPSDLMDAWNENIAPMGLAKVTFLSDSRKRKAALRLREHPDNEFWAVVLNNIRGSLFLRGLTKPRNPDENPFQINFDWLVDNDTNAVKIYEGKYNGQSQSGPKFTNNANAGPDVRRAG